MIQREIGPQRWTLYAVLLLAAAGFAWLRWYETPRLERECERIEAGAEQVRVRWWIMAAGPGPKNGGDSVIIKHVLADTLMVNTMRYKMRPNTMFSHRYRFIFTRGKP